MLLVSEKQLDMKTTIYFLFAVMFLAGCDKCREISCGTFGCEDGECICPEPLTGERCSDHKYRDYDQNFVGDIHYTVTTSEGVEEYTDESAEVYFNIGNGSDQIFFGSVDWLDNGAFNLTPLPGHAEQVTGSGALTGGIVTVHAEYVYASGERYEIDFTGTSK